MKKNLEITLDQAKELLVSMPSLSGVIYNSFPELKPNACICCEASLGYSINWIPYKTQKQLDSGLAYAQLTQLMAERDDCDVDWNDDSKIKFCIARGKDKIKEVNTYTVFHFLAFNTEFVRYVFFRENKELIKQFFQL